MGASRHPAFPAPSVFLGDDLMQTSDASRRENAGVYLSNDGELFDNQKLARNSIPVVPGKRSATRDP
jgi:hypothetical protein